MITVKGKFNNSITINGRAYNFEVSTLYNNNKAIIGYLSFREQGVPVLEDNSVVVSEYKYMITIHGFSKLLKEFNINEFNNSLFTTLGNTKGVLYVYNPLEPTDIINEEIPMSYVIEGGSIVMSPTISYIDTSEMIGFLNDSESYNILNHNLPKGDINTVTDIRRDLLKYFVNNLISCFVLSSSHLRVFLKIGVADIIISHNNYIVTLIPNSYLSCLYIPKVINVSNNIKGLRGCAVKYIKHEEDVVIYLKEVIKIYGNQTEFLNI